jgi:peptide/nickel transport system ATP-binding protein
MTLLDVNDLKVTYSTADRTIHAVNDVSFSVGERANYGLVGESGCGKSTIASAILDLLDSNATIEAGEIVFKGRDLLEVPPAELREILWEDIAYIPQSAMDALDPVMKTGAQIEQAITKHRDVTDAAARERVHEVFDMVGLDTDMADQYPNEFSGGMRQRVTIAMALALDPDLIIADEPTTGLDVIVQDKIIEKILEIQAETDSSLLLITHDIGVIAETTDELSVLYGGKVMEQGGTDEILRSPANPYTMGLRNAFPDIESIGEFAVSIPGTSSDLSAEPEECVFRSRCPFATERCERGHPELTEVDGRLSACHHADEAGEMRSAARDPETWGLAVEATGERAETDDVTLRTEGLAKWYTKTQGLMEQVKGKPPDRIRAVDGVSIDVHESEILGIAGESGCGKSTLGETIALLEDRTDGDILFKGEPIDEYLSEYGTKEFRSQVQIIFQDPFDSLNPRQTVRSCVSEPARIHGHDRETTRERVADALADVGLTPQDQYLDKYPHQLSGGERQRVAIARTLVLDPELLICDEPASMLDVSLKANILNILRTLADEKDIAIIYISHDLASLTQVADRLAIMYLGRVVEVGDTPDVIAGPKHPYSAALLSAAPKADPEIDRQRVLLAGEPESPVDLPSGCNFASRCPKARAECRESDPDLREMNDGGQRAACFFPVEDVDREILEETMDRVGSAD